MWEVEETLHDDLLDHLGSAGCLPAVCGSLPQTCFHSTRANTQSVRQAAGRNRLAACAPQTSRSPLQPMTLPERVKEDYETMNLTTGPHPMKLLRESLPNIWRAIDLVHAQHGSIIQIAGNVICRQRPGTAKGFVFISLEDETGVSNAIVDPDLFERFRLLITEEDFLLIEGEVQNSDNVVLIKTHQITPLAHLPAVATTLQAGENLVGSESHDFR
jgi:error-prone DNA polymerase